MRHSALLSVFLVATFVGAPIQATACTCTAPSLVDSWNSSALIFVGTVSEMTVITSGTLSGFTIVTFAPTKIWKGEVDTASARVLNPNHDGLCGYHFVLGEQYLVYADMSVGNDGWLRTSICTRTSGYFEGHLDISFLESVVSVEEKSWSLVKKLFAD